MARLILYINGVAGRRWPGYLLCGSVYTIAVCVLLVFMGDIRERELDMQPPPPSSAGRPPILLEVTPAAPGPGGPPGSIDPQDYEFDPNKLHVDDDGMGMGDVHQDPGLGVGSGNGSGIVLGYMGEDQIRGVDTGDYRWAKIFTGVDSYSGRLLLCNRYDGGGPSDGGEYAEVVGHQRKRGYSEPALPVLQECPSQENSSLSRADNSVLSLGLKDLDAISGRGADGCSIVNASYDGGGDEIDDLSSNTDSEVRCYPPRGTTLPRKMSDNTLFKERISKGTMTPPTTSGSIASGSGASGVTTSSARRLSVEMIGDRAVSAESTSRSLLFNNFAASHASGTNEEELKLIENEVPKSSYGTAGGFGKQCSLEGAVGGGGGSGGVPPESLVETTV